MHNGALDVSGRLFSIKSVGLTPSGTGRTINGEHFAHGIHVRRRRSSGRRRGGARADGHDRYVDGRDNHNDVKRVG